MNLNKIQLVFLLLFLISCEEKIQNPKPIPMGDPNSIITETDTQYLKNFTNDISPTRKKSSESQIASMMVQVDSLKSTQKLEDETSNSAPINGFNINFNECSVVFNNLYAHALNNTQDERKSNSVSYLKDGGELLEMKLQITGLDEIKVEERLTLQLAVEKEGERYILYDLGKYITEWYNLAGKDRTFISVGNNSLEFNEVNQQKIKNALVRELSKKKKNKESTALWMKAIENTKIYADAPCKILISSAQWRITGKSKNKRVQKLIQFDQTN